MNESYFSLPQGLLSSLTGQAPAAGYSDPYVNNVGLFVQNMLGQQGQGGQGSVTQGLFSDYLPERYRQQVSGSFSPDRTGGLAGNGTNFTDDQWAAIKTMNDQYGFLGNPVNQIGLGSLATLLAPGSVGMFGLTGGNPFTSQQRSEDAISQWRDSLAMDGGVPINTVVNTPDQPASTYESSFYSPSSGVTDGSDGRSYGISGGEGE